jgi:8-amino-7-oxononanoate synthase
MNGMIDFSSSLYLGMDHPSEALRPWPKFTNGIPAALGSPPGADETASRLAVLQGCQRGVLGRSTLDLFWDLFGILADGRNDIFLDAETYPIARWAAERAAVRGASLQTIRHHDADMLMELAKKSARRGMRPVLIVDGFCPGCGKAAPLAAYLDPLRKVGGLIVLDDTQALGVFGHSPSPDAPYGTGGGGTLRFSRIAGDDVLAISSLAKGFGAPVAVIVGSDLAIRYVEANSETRVHCSPPSIPAIRAAEHALDVNQKRGDMLRLRLIRLVEHFRRRIIEAGLRPSGGIFPVQTIETVHATSVFNILFGLGIKSVLRPSRVSFVLNCRHSLDDIDAAVSAIIQAITRVGMTPRRVSTAAIAAGETLASGYNCTKYASSAG